MLKLKSCLVFYINRWCPVLEEEANENGSLELFINLPKSTYLHPSRRESARYFFLCFGNYLWSLAV